MIENYSGKRLMIERSSGKRLMIERSSGNRLMIEKTFGKRLMIEKGHWRLHMATSMARHRRAHRSAKADLFPSRASVSRNGITIY